MVFFCIAHMVRPINLLSVEDLNHVRYDFFSQFLFFDDIYFLVWAFRFDAGL